jgi:hypothetical protein
VDNHSSLSSFPEGSQERERGRGKEREKDGGKERVRDIEMEGKRERDGGKKRVRERGK